MRINKRCSVHKKKKSIFYKNTGSGNIFAEFANAFNLRSRKDVE